MLFSHELLDQRHQVPVLATPDKKQELVSAIAGNIGAMPEDHTKFLAECNEDLVSVRMSEHVVEPLEIVDIHHQQRAVAVGMVPDIGIHPPLQTGPVEKPGQGIQVGLVGL